MEFHQVPPVRLNIGAGRQRIDGWLSIDAAGDPDIKADVRALPLPDDHADEAMAIHVFEHLYRWEAVDALREWRRVLKPGGLLILELPNLIQCCRAMIDGASDRMGIWGIYGDPGYGDPLMTHKWGWTPETCSAALREAGFGRIRIKVPQFHKKTRDMRLEARK